MIRERDLAGTVREVQRIPAAERRVILLTGIHPHEQTDRLAAFGEAEWRKHDVLVVVYPEDETAHAVWREQRERQGSLKMFQTLPRQVGHSLSAVEHQLTGSDPTTTVRFNGVPSNPSCFNGVRPRAARHVAIRAAEVGDPCFEPAIINALAPQMELTFGTQLPPHRILVEYWYKGTPALAPQDDYIERAIHMQYGHHAHRGSKVFDSGDNDGIHKTHLLPQYLVEPYPTAEDIAEFTDRHIHTLDQLFYTLAQQRR